MSVDEGQPVGHGGVFVLHERIAQLEGHSEASHTDHGLTFLVDGWFRIEHGTTLRAAAGSVTIVPAGVPHRPIDGKNLEYWLLGFCATCLRLDETQLLMSPYRRVRRGGLPIVDIPVSRRDSLLQRFVELKEECERGAPESPDLIRSLVLLILGEVRRAVPGETTGPEGSFVSRALEFIQQRCLGPISLRDVAAAVHKTPPHVAATVKNATGYSVGEWITAGRVAEAANRLSHTDDSIDEIAIHVGWRDTTHFIRQFRKTHGSTPAAWRRQHQATHAPRELPSS